MVVDSFGAAIAGARPALGRPAVGDSESTRPGIGGSTVVAFVTDPVGLSRTPKEADLG